MAAKNENAVIFTDNKTLTFLSISVTNEVLMFRKLLDDGL